MLALARKYRPAVLKDLVGQEVFVDVISNAIRMNRIHHAFLLTGTRGVGKTTSARILALSLNCVGEDGKGNETIDPCLKCDVCKSILNGTNQDIIEFDAASNTGVDSIREIIEQCSFSPMMSRYKIYIVDEVHMLSKSAFNALLKTLEEPPARVKFVFATTEIKKVPVTILSRCQKFYLRDIPEEKISSHLQNVLQQENINDFNIEAVNLIAKHANGSMRDGLSLLDQAINISSGKVDLTSVKSMLSLPDEEKIAMLFYKLYLGYADESLEIINSIMKNNADLNALVAELLNACCDGMKCVDKIHIQSINTFMIANLEKLNESHLLNMPRILRMWQMIANSLSEMNFINPNLFLTSLTFKICYVNTLPTPVEILKTVGNSNLKAAFEKFPEGRIVK
jgi:DNA polymerase-3 subunit gamma/tau